MSHLNCWHSRQLTVPAVSYAYQLKRRLSTEGICMQVILGTESGMITAIVRRVQAMLQAANRSDVDVEVIFPVAPEAITTRDQLNNSSNGNGVAQLPGGLEIVPGPAGG